MTREMRHESLERVLMMYPHDGLMDIMIGLALVVAALTIELDMAPFAGVFVAAFLPIALSVRKTVVLPRLSTEEIQQISLRQLQISKYLLEIGLTVLLLVSVIFLVALQYDWPVVAMSLVLGLVLVAAVMSYISGLRRVVGYVVLVAIIGGLGALVSLSFLVILAILGLIIGGTGSYLLLQFLRTYPAP